MAKIGAPTKYKPEYCEKLQEFMAKGMPYECFAATIDVCRETLYVWEKEYPEFFNAKKRAREKCYMMMMETGHLGMKGIMRSPEDPNKFVKMPSFNPSVWIFMMKNMHAWKDKIELSESDEIDDLTWVRTK